jgi:hypothetical protein
MRANKDPCDEKSDKRRDPYLVKEEDDRGRDSE